MRSYLASVLGFLPVFGLVVGGSGASAADLEHTLYIDLKGGNRVVVELFPSVAPQHVERVKTLARNKFYDGLVFHRVIDGFMAQTGDPTGTGQGGSDKSDLRAEFSEIPFVRGTLGMARTSDPDSANSQFFICFEDAPFLNGQYTVFGKVVSGMEFIDQIKKGEGRDGMVTNPDRMERVRVAADVSGK